MSDEDNSDEYSSDEYSSSSSSSFSGINYYINEFTRGHTKLVYMIRKDTNM